ncbi:MAG: 50S ribosomal protein L4 [Chloroflexi bacterium]|nr:50S ribosomal protein L4 [Chloroflexota bacterium]|tara:strand:- start:2728 stop:3384 length:657 start_codon:yes stop_codon:yes gene_type:complete
MKLVVKNNLGKSSGSVTVDDSVWSVQVNEGLIHQVVTSQLNNLRQGNHETKRRRDVEYSTAKMRPQKGSGRARLGSRSSMLQGGSVAHGPHKKEYKDRIPTKIRRSALKMILSDKISNGNINIIDKLQTNSPSTKYIADIVKELGLSGKTLLLVDSINENLTKSVRNIPDVNILDVSILNALEALKNKNILITRDAVKKIDKTWGSKASNNKNVKGKV